MDKFKIKDYTERLSKETYEGSTKMLYMWIKQEVITLSEFRELLKNIDETEELAPTDTLWVCERDLFMEDSKHMVFMKGDKYQEVQNGYEITLKDMDGEWHELGEWEKYFEKNIKL